MLAGNGARESLVIAPAKHHFMGAREGMLLKLVEEDMVDASEEVLSAGAPHPSTGAGHKSLMPVLVDSCVAGYVRRRRSAACTFQTRS